MLTRSDTITLRQQVDVSKTLDLLTMFQNAGKGRIDVRTILDEAAPKTSGSRALLERLEHLAESHETCNNTEFSAWMKVSRQTVYNWKDSNYLVYSGMKVNLPETLELWKSLSWLESR